MRVWKKHSDFFKQASGNAVANSETDIVTEKLRNSLSLRITEVENYVGAIAAWGNLTWKLKMNGVAIEPFTSQKDQIGQQGIPQIVQIDVEWPPASVLSVGVLNSSGVDYTAGIVLRGEYGQYE